MRSRFVTTPLWDPDLETGPDGSAQVRFTLPDDLTTFKLMAVVDHEADGFGSGEHELQVARPLLANPALPRILRVGDRALAGVVVHNNTDGDLDVEVAATAEGVTLDTPTRTERVAAGEAREVAFQLTEPQVGEATLTFAVTAGSLADRVRVTLPVERPRPSEVVATSGTTTTEARLPIARPDDVIAGVGGLEVVLSPTVLVGADESLRYLLDYPHGCLEQTATRVLAAVLARELGPRAGLDADPDQLDTWVRDGLARMHELRHGSGGYSLWAGGDAHAPATAWALEVTHRAGRKVDPEGVRFVRGFLGGEHVPRWWSADTLRREQVRAALTLARIGDGDAGHNERLFGHRASLSLVARAELLEAIARTTGPDRRTAELRASLEETLDLTPTTATIADPDPRGWDGEAAATAAAVSALVQAYPDHPLLPRMARGVVALRGSGRWTNTHTTVRAFDALAGYARVLERAGATSGRASLAGVELLTTDFPVAGRAVTAQLPMDELTSGELLVAGDGQLYYESRLRYARPIMPPRDQGFTLARKIEIVAGDGLASQVTPGSLVRVSLRVVTTAERRDVAVVDPLPAGLEPVDTFFATTARAEEGRDGPRPTWSDWVFSHRELDDAEVRLYADWMPAGIHTATYLARATTPGDYAHPAATVEMMYQPEVFGRTRAGRFVVGEAPLAKAE